MNFYKTFDYNLSTIKMPIGLNVKNVSFWYCNLSVM